MAFSPMEQSQQSHARTHVARPSPGVGRPEGRLRPERGSSGLCRASGHSGAHDAASGNTAKERVCLSICRAKSSPAS